MYCCTTLEGLIGSAGQRGIAVLVRDLRGDLDFVIQSRGVAYEDEKFVADIRWVSTINVSSEFAIAYCPFCGTQLPGLIARAPDYFRGLAEAHAKFIMQIGKR